jgi:hypothetical protein
MKTPFASEIRCAKCKRQVDLAQKYKDMDDNIIYVVKCHGEKEIVELKKCDLVSASKIEMGEAFSSDKKVLK